MDHEPRERNDQDEERPANPRRPKPVVFLSLIEDHLQASCPHRQQPKPKPVELARVTLRDVLGILDVPADHEHRQRANRDIDVERVPPAVGVRQPAAQRRTQHRCHHDPKRKQRHRCAALLWRKALQQYRLRQRLQRPAASALHDAGNQNEPQRRRRSAEERRNRKNDHAGDQKPLPPEPQREPVARRQNDRVRHEVAGQHPSGLVVRRRKRSGNVRQRHRRDRRVQHLHKGRQHHGDRDEPGIDPEILRLLTASVGHAPLPVLKKRGETMTNYRRPALSP